MQRLLFLDFETYWTSEYSLRRLSIPEYIFSPLFAPTLLAYAWDSEPVQIVAPADVGAFIGAVLVPQANEITTIVYNAPFDNSILSWRYGFVPKHMIDVLGMARATLGHKLKRFSLQDVTEYLGNGKKDGSALIHMQGVRPENILAHPQFQPFAEYAVNDVNVTRRNFYSLIEAGFPQSEFAVMDKVLRTTVCPQFQINRGMLGEHIAHVRAQKEELLVAAGASPAELQSASHFQTLLEAAGVEVEFKQGAKGAIPCFAKTDEFMQKLLNSDDPGVAALAAARMGIRSTIEESRAGRFLAIANQPWETLDKTLPPGNGLMPIPLRYAGAHTHRLSGDWKLNPQNLPSGRGRTKGTKLRAALQSGPGKLVVKCDLSQIEARLTAWFCGQKDLLEAFASGGDPYSDLGCAIFGITLEELKNRGGKESLERFIGKGGILGLGFQCGATKFYNMVLRAARSTGMDMTKLLAVWTPNLAQLAVDTYRERYPNIPAKWYSLDRLLKSVWLTGVNEPIRVGPVLIGKGYVEGPHGLRMLYEPSERQMGGGYTELGYRHGEVWTNIYGGKFLENIIQFLARILLMHAALRISARSGYDYALQEHDALAYVVPESYAHTMAEIIQEETRRSPSWAKDLPIDSEIGIGPSYGETAKWDGVKNGDGHSSRA